jgi:hypothetical protein
MSESEKPQSQSQESVLERHASWIELFFDLVVVAGIGQLAHLLHGTPDWSDFGLYALLYLAFWTAWACFTMYGNVAGDRVRIPSMLIAMFGLSVMMAAVAGIQENHALAFAVAYVAVRLLAGRVWRDGQIVVDWPIAQMSLGIVPWIISFWVEGDARYWLWAVGVTIDLLIMFVVSGSAVMEDAQEKLDRVIRFRGNRDDKIPELEALHSDRAHLAERLGLYVIIVLGEGVILVISAASKLVWDSTVVSLAVVLRSACRDVVTVPAVRQCRCPTPTFRHLPGADRHGTALLHHRRHRSTGRRIGRSHRTRSRTHPGKPAVAAVRKRRSLFRNQRHCRTVCPFRFAVAPGVGAAVHRNSLDRRLCRHSHERNVDHLGARPDRGLAERLRVRAGAAHPPNRCAPLITAHGCVMCHDLVDTYVSGHRGHFTIFVG